MAVRGKIKTDALQQAIYNSAYFLSIATDENGVIQIFNVGAQHMLGYPAEEVINKITPADLSDPAELIARAELLSGEFDTPIAPGFEALVFKASRGIEDIYDLTYVRKDGSRFPAVVSVTALCDAQQRIIGYLLIGTDNTARREVEAKQALLDQQLRDQQFYTRSLIESNLDALMMTDPQGNISDVNRQMMTLTGRSRDELIGTPSQGHFTDPALAEAAIKRVLTENKVADFELTVRAENGVETDVSFNAATIYDRDHKLQGVFASARDITDRKALDRALRENNIELERANRMKSEFVATMSHELRTPLNAIIGFSEALKDGLMGPITEHQQEYISDIFASGHHLLSLINDILDLSKVEAGMMKLELDRVDLAALLLRTLSIVKEKAATHEVRVQLEIGDELDHPFVDVRKTKQIAYNLLSNAVKFSRHGGVVTLTVQFVPRACVGVLSEDWPQRTFPLADSGYEEFVEICVSDDGIGVSEPDMAKLFHAFSQIDSSLARKFEGTGLGLVLVKQLAELHGGTVAVASREGEGARFAVWLPLRTAAQEIPSMSSGAPATGVVQSDGKHYALVVEDDRYSAELIRVLLEAEGFTVIVAVTAEAALETAPLYPLSLITLDIHLPGLDGWEFLRRLRQNHELAIVPVVIISGSGRIDGAGVALARGASAVLHKPISRVELTAALARLGLPAGQNRVRTVLVVDDDPKAVELIASCLSIPAYAVVRAYGGREAIAMAKRVHPDLILLDLMAPDLNGFDVVEAIRRDPECSHIPILVVTATELTTADRAALNGNGNGNGNGNAIHIVDMPEFDSAGFLAEVRRALPTA